MQKLVGFGDLRTSKIVARIADEEVAHVAVGVYWFVDVCQKMGCTPCSAFKGFVASPFLCILFFALTIVRHVRTTFETILENMQTY